MNNDLFEMSYDRITVIMANIILLLHLIFIVILYREIHFLATSFFYLTGIFVALKGWHLKEILIVYALMAVILTFWLYIESNWTIFNLIFSDQGQKVSSLKLFINENTSFFLLRLLPVLPLIRRLGFSRP